MRPRTHHMTPPAVDPRRPGLMWPVAIDPGGVTGPTPAQARGRHWEAGTRGLYLPVDRDPALAVDQRIVTAAALLPAGGAVTGWGALRWAGARYLDGTRGRHDLPVDLAVPGPVIRSREGIRPTEEVHLRRETVELDGLTLSAHVASVGFAVRHATTLEDAVAMVDRACAADLVSIAELRAFRHSLTGQRWVTRLDRAVDLAVENCWSPMETVLRLCWRSMGITNVVCNQPVFALDGTFLGTPDVLDVDTGTGGEYDGALHLAGPQRAKDIRREGVLRRHGLEYVEMTAGDLRDTTDFRQRTMDARGRAEALPRNWTLAPPPWWTETHTVELRRALAPWQRDRFLRWQAS
ncbi:hypothetical protein FXB39_00330 [Nocardioides sp. BGMRC 2183]|nr:hypothetical protein FXB39_00330 [Nocardioides sp. BGMRC 2183]